MAVDSLPNLPESGFVFIDANVFIYALTAQSAECRHLFERCLREEVTGIALFETVNEVTHRFMIAEALSKGLITAGGTRALRNKFQQIPTLTDYWLNTQRMLALNLLFMPVNETIIRNAQTVRQEAGLLTNDSMIVAGMREYGLSFLASNDADFERVRDITVFKPTDLP
ncbi:MAG: PIN domain-containing protein [Terriglobia bacterium]|jgi:predicted nucleic acid-binding protein